MIYNNSANCYRTMLSIYQGIMTKEYECQIRAVLLARRPY